VDTLVGAIIKRLSDGHQDGVAILAEGLVEGLSPEDLQDLVAVERDAHDNIRIAEVNFGEILKAKVQAGLKRFNIKTTIVAKNIGYELRCADAIPFDMEYTRDLGYCAAKYLDEGGNGVIVAMVEGKFRPLPFPEMMDPATGRTKLRMVDVTAERYRIARRYMLRLRKDDFNDPHALAKFAAVAGIGLDQFRAEFEYLVEDEPPPIHLTVK
jgi:6-phosphofructokinase